MSYWLIWLKSLFTICSWKLFQHFRILKSFRELWGNKRLLNLIEQLIGPDIAGMPNWNLRDKTPHNEATTVPWHQGRDCRFNHNLCYFLNRFHFDSFFWLVAVYLIHILHYVWCYRRRLSVNGHLQSVYANCLDPLCQHKQTKWLHGGNVYDHQWKQ